METQPEWYRLGQIVKHRRDELGLSQDQVARLGGPSTTVQQRVENGTPYLTKRATLNKYDEPLKWQPGSALATLDGGTPVNATSSVSIQSFSNRELADEVYRRLSANESETLGDSLPPQDQVVRPQDVSDVPNRHIGYR